MAFSQLALEHEANSLEHKISVSVNSYCESETTERLQRAQWVRAAILGANDGLLSTTAIMLGVGAAKEDARDMILSGLAGALAGCCSMAVGEFVSVSTQRDIEKATTSSFQISASQNNDLEKDAPPGGSITDEAKANIKPKMSPAGLMSPGGRIHVAQIIDQQNVKEGPNEEKREAVVLANPYKAAVASGLAFLSGSFVPLVSTVFVSQRLIRIVAIIVVTSIALALLGCVGAHLGGSPVRISASRVVVGGWIAMGITYGLLKPFDGHDRH